MAKVAYVPYDNTMASIFSTCNITIQTYNFEGVYGWLDTDYSAARGEAWQYLIENGTDEQWSEWESLITGGYTVNYWSVEKGLFPV